MRLQSSALLVLLLFTTVAAAQNESRQRSVRKIVQDLFVPSVTTNEPAAGLRVRQTTLGWEGSAVHHALWLPTDWKPGAKFPVLVEYAGNGGFTNALGDSCDGTVEGSKLGYGLSGGSNFIWIAMPFVEVVGSNKQNAMRWWGDVEETKRYTISTVKDVCERFGGDASRIVLCGFSRGAIGCNYIGLHDDEIAKLWRGFFCHSHYDGVRTNWPYAGADRPSAAARLARVGDRPVWASHEGYIDETREFIQSVRKTGDYTFVMLPFPNHTDEWLLRPLSHRTRARDWLRDAMR